MLWLKRFAVVMGVLLVLLMVILAYALYFVNSASFKTQLQDAALEKADIRLRIDGDIQWSFFPWLGLELDNIGVAMGDDPEILQFDRAEFGLAILPLLKHSIQVDQVRLVNLKANLNVDKSGRANWQRPSTGDDNTSTAEPAATASSNNAYQAAASGEEESVIPDLKLDKLTIENAQVVYQDAQTQQKIDATFNVNLSDVKWNKAWPMVMDAVVTQSDLQGDHPLTVKTNLTADLTVFPDRQVFSLENMSLETELAGDALPTSPLESTVAIKQLDMDVPQENLFIDGMSLQSLGITATAKAQLYQVLSDPQYTATVEVAQFNPRDVLKQLKIDLPEMADDTALTKASLNMSLEGSKDELLIQPLSLSLDDTKMQANLVTKLSPLRWDANISGEQLDLDRYLPPEAEASAKSATANNTDADKADADKASNATSTDASQNNELVPLELVRSLNGHFGLVFDQLTVKKLKLDKVSLDATMANGLVQVSPAAITLYNGQASLDARYDARTNTPDLTVSTRAKDIQVQPLLKDFMALDKLSGTTSLTGELSARGNKIDALTSSMNGDFLANLNDGALVGINLTKTVCQGIAKIRDEKLESDSFSDNTAFETMKFPIHIVSGEVSTPGLVMTSAGISVSGDGNVSLPNKSLDYQVDVAIAGSELDNACRVNARVTKLAFPVVCKGQFSDDPAGLCRPDAKRFANVVAELAKAELKDKADKKVEELKDKVNDKLKDKLKSLF